MRPSGLAVAALLLLTGAGVAAWDLQGTQTRTIVVYTTPALKDVLEKGVVPRFESATGYEVALVYVAAGDQYNRLLMSRGHQEADVFLHASPLFLEKGEDDGFFAPFRLANDEAIAAEFKGKERDGGRTWYGFGWSPLVEVYATKFDKAPDLATFDGTFGFAHPQLSNNGVYTVLFFEEVSPEAGQRMLAQTRVQPVNARTNIGGVADGSFDVTLGYEAVTLFYRGQGAKLEYALPVVDGEQVTTPVLCSASLVDPPKPGAEALVRFLFTDETQQQLGKYWFRPTVNGTTLASAGDTPLLDLTKAERIDYDWSRWRELSSALPRYVVQ